MLCTSKDTTKVVIPDLIKPALACPVLDTGDLIRGNPGFQCKQEPSFFVIDPCFRWDDVWIPAGVYTVLDTGWE